MPGEPDRCSICSGGVALIHVTPLGDEKFITRGYPDHAAALPPVAPDGADLDVETLIEAEHLWCVRVEGDFAFRHEPEAHRPQAEFIARRLRAGEGGKG